MVDYDSGEIPDNDRKAFKESFFKCESVEEDNVNGRITKMIFQQIKKL